MKLETTAEQRSVMRSQVLKGWSIWSTEADVRPLLRDVDTLVAAVVLLRECLDSFIDSEPYRCEKKAAARRILDETKIEHQADATAGGKESVL